MKLNIEGKEPEMAKIQRVKDKEGEEYIAKVICYTQSVANTKSFGDVYCVASIEHAVRGEIMFSLLLVLQTQKNGSLQFHCYMIQ